MARTLTIRLNDRYRTILEEEARRRGTGLSAFVRQMAEAEAKRILREQIRAETERLVEYIKTDPEAQAFFEDWGTPSDLPE